MPYVALVIPSGRKNRSLTVSVKGRFAACVNISLAASKATFW